MLIILTVISCNKTNSFDKSSRYDGEIIIDNKKININAVTSFEKRKNGLSGVLPNSFNKNQGMLFVYPKSTTLSFWMIDTYFDLDIIYLDKGFKIIKITKSLPKHPGYSNNPPIARDTPIFGQFALELRADAILTNKLKVGDQLKWNGKKTLKELTKSAE